MGHYGTTLRTTDGTLYIDSIPDAKTEYQIEEKINEANENINKIKSRLLQLATCTPKDVFTSDEDGDILYKINSEFDSNWEWLEEEMSDYVEATIAKRIVDDWKYTDENARFSEVISPQEKCGNVAMSLKEINDSEKDTSIDGILNRAKKSMSDNSYNDRYKISGKYAAFFDGELYVDLYGKWLFDSKDDALSRLTDSLRVHPSYNIDAEYVKKNKEFILSLRDLIDWDKVKSESANAFYKPIADVNEYEKVVNSIIDGTASDTDPIRLSSTMGYAYDSIILANTEIRRII